jgi:hypothetical protein
MPNTIAQNLQRLVNAKSAISEAITAKGGTVSTGDGFEDFPAGIASIPSGGGDVKIGTFSIDTGAIDSGATDMICIKKNKMILAHAFTPNIVKIDSSSHVYYYLHFDDFDIAPIEYIKLIRINTETGESGVSDPIRTEYSNNRLRVVVADGTYMNLVAGHRFVIINLP